MSALEQPIEQLHPPSFLDPYYLERGLTASQYFQKLYKDLTYVTRAMPEDSTMIASSRVVEAFLVDQPDGDSILRGINGCFLMSLVLDNALIGNEVTYDHSLINSKFDTIIKSIAITGLMVSFSQNPFSEYIDFRSTMTTPEAMTPGVQNPSELTKIFKSIYESSKDDQELGIPEITIDLVLLSSLIYARAARSGNSTFVNETINELVTTYERLRETYPYHFDLGRRIYSEVNRSLDEKPNELIQLIKMLEEEDHGAVRFHLVTNAMVVTYTALKKLANETESAKNRMNIATEAILASNYPEVISNFNVFFDGLEVAHLPQNVDINLKPMELNWEVLPPGELENAAREIIEGMSNGHTPEIDLTRLNALEEIRELWGKDNCYYVRGKLGKRRTVRDGDNIQPDEYIVLILQDRDTNDNLFEHAVAESPIVGPHAMYVFRGDVSGNWRDVMSLSKTVARARGARRLKHLTRTDYHGYTISEKVSVLLSCAPDEFSRIKFDGTHGFRIIKHILELGDGL